MAETGSQLISQASMEGRPVRVEALRALAAGPKHVAQLVRMAEQWGVPVHGPLNYQESKELYGVR
jgi:hypothetical protein